MATVDLTEPGSEYYANSGTRHTVLLQKTLDFAVTNRGAGDVLQLFDVAAGDHVVGAAIKVVTVEGATQTFDLGDGSDADGYIDGANGNALGTTGMTYVESTGAVVGYAGGKFYTAADTIDLTVVEAADACKVIVTVLVNKLQPREAVDA